MGFTRDNCKQLFAGGVAGCCAKFVIAPLDRTKILLQAQHPTYSKYGVFSCMRQIQKREGFLSLWKGTSMMMYKVFPYSAIQFFVFEKTYGALNSKLGKWHLNSLIAGVSAGISAVFFTYPLDLMRARMAYQVTGKDKPITARQFILKIYKEEGGIRAFYRGITPSILGIIPYGGISFYTYNNLKEFLVNFFPNSLAQPDPNNPDILVLAVWANILTGGFAGAISQTVAYPLDVARRKMQLSKVLPDPKAYRTIRSTLIHIYKTDGIRRGLFRGLSINYIRVIPQQAIAYTVYERMRQVLKLNKKNKKR